MSRLIEEREKSIKKEGEGEEEKLGMKQCRGSGHRGVKDFRAARVEGRAAAASRGPWILISLLTKPPSESAAGKGRQPWMFGK